VVFQLSNRILTTDTYHDEIRGRLGVGDDIVSDSDIDALSVLPIAEAKVIKSVPNYAVLIDDDANYVYTAAICMVASILAPSMTSRIKKAKADFDFKIENQFLDWNKRSIALVDEAYGFIDLITDQVGIIVPAFGVSGPTRVKDSHAGC
jgi:hypothetical protein